MQTLIAIKTNNLIRIVTGTVLILLVPLVAMLFTDDVNWNWFDFAVIGTLLIGAGLIFELVAKRVTAKYRPLIAVVLLVALLLVWAELAVGLFGSPFAGS